MSRNADCLPSASRALKQFTDAPDVIGDPGLHSGCYSQRLVNAAEIIEGVPQYDGVLPAIESLIVFCHNGVVAAESTGPTYTCAVCKGTFVSDWSDEEAHQEQLEAFGRPYEPDDAVVCDDCYQKMIIASPPGEFWPNCDVPDCEYKTALPATKCYAHQHGKTPEPFEKYSRAAVGKKKDR